MAVALRSGNPEAVQTMYYMLIPFADSIGFSRGSLKRQLEREYDTELQELPHSWDTNIAPRTAVSDSAPQVSKLYRDLLSVYENTYGYYI